MVDMPFSTVTNGAQDKFFETLVGAVNEHKKVYIITDLDGTLFPFAPNPDDVQLDPKCGQGLKALQAVENLEITALTGRFILRAKEMLSDAGDIDIVGSHGVELLKKDGQIERYAFSPEQETQVQGFKNGIRDLESRFKQYGLVVELDKHGSAGVNVASMDPDLGKTVLEEAKTLLQGYESESFKIAQEGPNEIEIRPHGFGKDFGITNFIKPEKDATIFFLCDSLGPHGTDTAAAIILNDKSQFDNGHVIMVMNGRNKVPESGSSYAPFAVFDSQAHLGEALVKISKALHSPVSVDVSQEQKRAPR